MANSGVRDTGLGNHGRSSLCGEAASGWKSGLRRQSYGKHFLYILSASTHASGGKALPLSWI